MRGELETRWQALSVAEVDRPLVEAAAQAAEYHGLRANDAVHLASALILDDSELVFASWDEELRREAARAGLAVAP